MQWRLGYGMALVAGVLAAGGPMLRGQGTSEKKATAVDCRDPKNAGAKACAPKAPAEKATENGKGTPPAGDPFAFPEEQSRHGGDAAGSGQVRAPGASPGAGAGSSAASGAGAGSSAASGASSGAGLGEMPTGAVPDPPASSEGPVAGGSSSSTSGGEGASSSRDGAAEDDADVPPTTADPRSKVKAAPLKDLGSRTDSTEARRKLEATRVDDDVTVGRFYLKDGNAQGAYLRFKDAVERDAGDADAQFGLAESARRLGKADEAMTHYRECLKLDADGEHAKAARKALAPLEARAKR